MNKKNNTRKYEDWYEDISLGIQTIRKSGSSFSITIPKKIVVENDIKVGDKVHGILIRRKRKYLGEKTENEVWVKMNKKEQIKFTEFLKREHDLNTVIENLD